MKVAETMSGFKNHCWPGVWHYFGMTPLFCGGVNLVFHKCTQDVKVCKNGKKQRMPKVYLSNTEVLLKVVSQFIVTCS